MENIIKNKMQNSDNNKTQNFPDYDFLFQFVIFGGSDTGKSALLQKYHNPKTILPKEHNGTIGVDMKQIYLDTISKRKASINIWDPDGRSIMYEKFVKAYIRGAQGFILCYSVTDIESYQHIDQYFMDIQSHANAESAKNIILVGTKCDLENQREVSYEQGVKKADVLKIKFMESSALKNINVQEPFQALTDMNAQQELTKWQRIDEKRLEEEANVFILI